MIGPYPCRKDICFPEGCGQWQTGQLFNTPNQGIHTTSPPGQSLKFGQKQGQKCKINCFKCGNGLGPGHSQQNFKVLSIAELPRGPLFNQLPCDQGSGCFKICQKGIQQIRAYPQAFLNKITFPGPVKPQPLTQKRKSGFKIGFAGIGPIQIEFTRINFTGMGVIRVTSGNPARTGYLV